MSLNWKIEWDGAAVKTLKKLSHPAQKQIIHYLETRIQTAETPRRFGEALAADKKACGDTASAIIALSAALKTRLYACS